MLDTAVSQVTDATGFTHESMPLLIAAGPEIKTKWWVIALLISSEIFERWCYFTILLTIPQISTWLFDTKPAAAKGLANTFCMMVHIVPLLTTILADEYFGNMVTSGMCIHLYIAGLISISLGAGYEYLSLYYLGLFAFIFLGTGLKQTLLNLAKGQLVKGITQSQKDFDKEEQRFYNVWHVGIYSS